MDGKGKINFAQKPHYKESLIDSLVFVVVEFLVTVTKHKVYTNTLM